MDLVQARTCGLMSYICYSNGSNPNVGRSPRDILNKCFGISDLNVPNLTAFSTNPDEQKSVKVWMSKLLTPIATALNQVVVPEGELFSVKLAFIVENSLGDEAVFVEGNDYALAGIGLDALKTDFANGESLLDFETALGLSRAIERQLEAQFIDVDEEIDFDWELPDAIMAAAKV